MNCLVGVGRSLRAQVGGDFPVFLGDEAPDLAFAVGDQPHRDRLHAARAQVPRTDFLPEQRAELIADHAVQEPPRLLGVDHIHVDRAGLAECLLDGPLGDFVERDPADAVFLQIERLLQVPGNGFAFAVRVSRQIDQPGPSGGAFQVADRFFLGRHDLVRCLVAFGHFEAELPFGKVAHMAHARLDHVSRAKELADRRGLLGALDDHERRTIAVELSRSSSRSDFLRVVLRGLEPSATVARLRAGAFGRHAAVLLGRLDCSFGARWCPTYLILRLRLRSKQPRPREAAATRSIEIVPTLILVTIVHRPARASAPAIASLSDIS